MDYAGTSEDRIIRARCLVVPPDSTGAPREVIRTVEAIDPRGPLIRTLEVGVCGTDIQIVAGTEGQLPASAEEMVLGHEVLGRVVNSSTPGIETGQLVTCVVRDPDPVPCSQCRRGRPDLCSNGSWKERGIRELDGFMAEYWRAPADKLVPVPEELIHLGVLIEPASIVVKALDTLRTMDERLGMSDPSGHTLVIGCGIIGLLTTAFLRFAGHKVTVVDPAPPGSLAAQAATSFGAEYQSHQLVPGDMVTEQMIAAHRSIIDAAGVAFLPRLLATHGAENASCCVVGLPSGQHAEVDGGALLGTMVKRNQVLFGVVNSSRVHFEDAIELLREVDATWPGVIGSTMTRIPFDRFREAFLPHARAGAKETLVFR
ncbi:alcohol dehydrogenase catalytic domain-containing protein [Nocardia sp. NPDC050793]|uniref:alcohol dehydrogenase catalytic domain-containing protein n=1 Tax=Nocardia sp. NPDC050793 TaxID=3155159 RepID=UPI0033C2CEAC